MKKKIIVFTRVPWPEDTKTRLRSALSPEDCAELQGCMLRHVLAQCRVAGIDRVVCYTPAERKSLLEPCLQGEPLLVQQGGGLGERMARAVEETLKTSEACVLVGSDLPFLTPETFLEAFRLLEESDAVLGPANDGGYYLVGMKAFHAELFSAERYGGSSVLSQTLRAARKLGLTVGLCAQSRDLDVKEDLYFLSRQISEGRLRCPEVERFLESRGFLGERRPGA